MSIANKAKVLRGTCSPGDFGVITKVNWQHLDVRKRVITLGSFEWSGSILSQIFYEVGDSTKAEKSTYNHLVDQYTECPPIYCSSMALRCYYLRCNVFYITGWSGSAL
jgi:hypothetical protein